MLQNEGFRHVYHRISSPWLKEFLNFDDLNYTRMKDFKTFITEYLHHGCGFRSEMLQNEGFEKVYHKIIFTMVEENFICILEHFYMVQ